MARALDPIARSDDGPDAAVTPIQPSDSHRPPSPPSRTLRAGVGRLARAWRSVRPDPDVDAARQLLPEVLRTLASADPDAGRWSELRSRRGDPALLIVGAAPGEPAAVVRFASSAANRRGLRRAATALSTIRSALAPDARDVVPELLGQGEAAGRAWVAERAAVGVPGSTLLGDPVVRRRAVAAIAAAVAPVHEVAARPLPASDGDDIIGRWTSARVTSIAGAIAFGADEIARMDAAAERLRATLAAVRPVAGWIHGDLWVENALFEGAAARVSGLVDWDSAAPDELPLHDSLHLALTTRRRVERRHLGPVVAELLTARDWADDDLAALGLERPTAWEEPLESLGGLDAGSALLLYWLRFVVANVERHPSLARDRQWVARNVHEVVSCL